MKLSKTLHVVLMMYCCIFTSHAIADFEIEGNDTFATRNIFHKGVSIVEGIISRSSFYDLDFEHADYSFFNQYSKDGSVLEYDIPTGASTAGKPYFAAVSFPAPARKRVDLLLGEFDSKGLKRQVIDGFAQTEHVDVGQVAPMLNGNVAMDDKIHLKAGGEDDSNFYGTTTIFSARREFGPFNLSIFMGERFAPDVDYFSFDGLNPGDEFRAKIKKGDNFDPFLVKIDDNGVPIQFNNGEPPDGLALLTGIVPDTGVINLYLTAFNVDAGSSPPVPHPALEEGKYVLSFTTTATVPISASVLFFVTSLFGLLIRHIQAK